MLAGPRANVTVAFANAGSRNVPTVRPTKSLHKSSSGFRQGWTELARMFLPRRSRPPASLDAGRRPCLRGLIKDNQQTAFQLNAAKNGPAARAQFRSGGGRIEPASTPDEFCLEAASKPCPPSVGRYSLRAEAFRRLWPSPIFFASSDRCAA
jgi:hypothetical protein